MGRDIDYQCIAYPPSGIRKEHFSEYEGVPFIFCPVFCLFRNFGADPIVLSEYGHWANDCRDCVADFFRHIADAACGKSMRKKYTSKV